MPPSNSPAEALTARLAAKRWTRCQVYAVVPGRSIRIDIAALVASVSLITSPAECLRVTFTSGFLVTDQDRYREFWMEWPTSDPFHLLGPIKKFDVQTIGSTRLAVVMPGEHENIVCVLFAEDDDGANLQVFPSFTFGPIDLDEVARSIHQVPGLEQSTGVHDA